MVDPFWAIIGLIFGVLILFYATYAKRAGRIMGRFHIVEEAKQPKLFKAYYIIALLIGFFSVGYVIFVYIYFD